MCPHSLHWWPQPRAWPGATARAGLQIQSQNHHFLFASCHIAGFPSPQPHACCPPPAPRPYRQDTILCGTAILTCDWGFIGVCTLN